MLNSYVGISRTVVLNKKGKKRESRQMPRHQKSLMAAPSPSYAPSNPSRSTETAREMSALRTAEPFGEGVPFGDVRDLRIPPTRPFPISMPRPFVVAF